MQSQSKSQQDIVVIDKLILKFRGKFKGPRIAREVLKKTKTGRVKLPYTKTCFKSTLIKTEWFWCKNRHIDE